MARLRRASRLVGVVGLFTLTATIAQPVRPHAEKNDIVVGEAYGELCFWLALPEDQRASCGGDPWSAKMPRRAMKCLQQKIAEEGRRRGTSAEAVVTRSIETCEPADDIARWSKLPPAALVAVAKQRSCPTDPATWLALEVRQAAHDVPYWLLWHMALGISHFVIYDNNNLEIPLDARDSEDLRAALEPFTRQGYVTYVPFSGRAGAQTQAYRDAVARATRGGAVFLGALDADEFLMPFEDRCATTLMTRCLAREDCGSVSVNWRVAKGDRVARAANTSFWAHLDFHVGRATWNIKTFARLGPAYRKWGWNVHFVEVAKGFRAYRAHSGNQPLSRIIPALPKYHFVGRVTSVLACVVDETTFLGFPSTCVEKILSKMVDSSRGELTAER
mmetsp:Transcript_20563/g.61306  ORF Transcript_20563/g.61306 Transcript_20563/m.61306 type:complete len:389 (+) Transcript_20563:953-2119(+)